MLRCNKALLPTRPVLRLMPAPRRRRYYLVRNVAPEGIGARLLLATLPPMHCIVVLLLTNMSLRRVSATNELLQGVLQSLALVAVYR
jgi:hypothetical protein